MQKFNWALLLVLSLALAVIILDTTILNVALASIITDLHTDIQNIQWVITAYSLTLAALTITGGRLGDLLGRKRMFMVGAFLFAVGSFIASVSPNVAWLIVGESIVEGLGAALMLPATSSLLVANFEGRARTIAFGMWGGIAGASAALGPILGGFLATNYSWRWGFRVNLIVVAVLLIGALFLIPESRDDKERKQLDVPGVFLSALGMLSLVFGLIESSRYGWWKAKEVFVLFGHTLAMPGDLSIVPLFLIVGAAILGLFLWWEYLTERDGNTPLLSASIFKNRGFSSGIATTFVMSLGQTGLIFALPVFFQAVRGLDAFHTGLSLLPMSLSLLITAPLSAAMSKKLSPKFLISVGLLLNALAYLVMRSEISVTTTVSDLIPGLMLFGVGMGLVMSHINNLTLSAVPKHQAGEASGVMNTLRQVGATFGSAVMGAILVGALGSKMVSGVAESTTLPAELKDSLETSIVSQASNVEFGGGAHLSNDVPESVQEEIVAIGHNATTEATKQTLAYGGIFAFFGFVVSLILLPSKKRQTAEEAAAYAVQETPVNEQPIEQPVVEQLPVALAPSMPETPLSPKADPPLVGTSVTPLSSLTPSTPSSLSTKTIAELIALDSRLVESGEPSLDEDVQLLLDLRKTQKRLAEVIDQRLVVARRYWDLGVGKKIGFTSLAEYADSIPAVPVELKARGAERIIYCERRLSASEWCELLGVTPKNGPTAPALSSLTERGPAEWVIVSPVAKHRGLSMASAASTLDDGEQTADLLIGLAILANDSQVLEHQYLDLPASTHDHSPQGAACLGLWNNERQLRWRWTDHADPRCGSLTVRRS